MNESFLHFIWRFQKFNAPLKTVNNELVNVFYPGTYNLDVGPDFSEARIKIGDIEWNGQVEIHIKSSDWERHNHSIDQAYNAVVLHVVWMNDREILREDKTTIHTVELKSIVDPNLVADYRKYLNTPNDIPCHAHLDSIDNLIWMSNLDRMFTYRLERKSRRIMETARSTNFDWEETAYQLLGRSFGFSLNGEPFQKLVENLPLKVVAKHSNNSHQIEALIFGSAGLLDDPVDDYQQSLKEEFAFLSNKYGLNPSLHRLHWKLGKMRPSNFPTVRLAQFASIMSNHQKLFSMFCEVDNVSDLKKKLCTDPTDYWRTHYDFGKSHEKLSNGLGDSSLQILIINSIAPILAAYSKYTDEPIKIEKAVNLLEELPPEINRYTKKWIALKRKPKSAFDSQAQISLYKDFCTKKNCLNCGIGTSIFNK